MGEIQGGYSGPKVIGRGLICYCDLNIPYVTKPNSNLYGNTWIDLTGRGNNGTMSCALNGNQFNTENCTDYPSFSTVNNLSYWDFTSNTSGNSRNIKFPQLIPTTGSFTIEIWIRRNSTNVGDRESLFSNANGADGYRFGINTNGTLYYLIGGTGGAGYSEGAVGSGYSVTDNNWKQCVMVFDRNAELSATRQVISHTNGVQRGTVNISSGGVGTGDGLPGVSRWCCERFRGLAARLLIYSRALTATEVTENFNVARSIYGI